MQPANPNDCSTAGSAASRVDATADLVKRLCLAESIGRIYSVSHPKGRAAVRAAYDALQPLLEQNGSLSINMAGGKILVGGLPVEERNPLVGRFVNAFQQIHVDNLLFTKGLSWETFEEFFRIFLQGAKVINASGGLAAMLEAKGISHVQIQRVSYVLVHEDEKVVRRDAQVIESGPLPKPLDDEQLVRYMVGEVLKKAGERRWLINEIKNNPGRMAALITEGIELASSRAEAGLTPEQTIEGLIENIKLIGQSLVEAKSGGEADEAALQQAILTLESEVRARSRKLMSSETAVGFVNEVLAVITHYADQARASKISREILKGERSLRETEKLLKSLTPENMTSVDFLKRIQELLVQNGVTAEQLQKLARTASPRPPAQPRKPRAKRVRKPVLEAISAQLRDRGLDPQQGEQLSRQLGEYFESELAARTSELKQERQQLAERVRELNHLLDQLDLAIIIWDTNGTIQYAHKTVGARLQLAAGQNLCPAVLECLGTLKFPLGASDEQLRGRSGLGESDAALLRAVEQVVTSPAGVPMAALLRIG